jgi:uncharacterized protein YfaQ (DUF2300 family)
MWAIRGTVSKITNYQIILLWNPCVGAQRKDVYASMPHEAVSEARQETPNVLALAPPELESYGSPAWPRPGVRVWLSSMFTGLVCPGRVAQ